MDGVVDENAQWSVRRAHGEQVEWPADIGQPELRELRGFGMVLVELIVCGNRLGPGGRFAEGMILGAGGQRVDRGQAKEEQVDGAHGHRPQKWEIAAWIGCRQRMPSPNPDSFCCPSPF